MRFSLTRVVMPIVLAAAIAALAFTVVAAQQSGQDEVQLRAAIKKESVDGDLKGAIAIYQQLRKSADRAVAAQALVRMGQCYEKLGAAESAEARKAYEEVVGKFSDQAQAAADARARLAALGVAAAGQGQATSSRVVWTGSDGKDPCCVSPDGRFLAYQRWGRSGGSLFIRDFVTGNDRQVTAEGATQSAQNPVFSHDSRQLAYMWYDESAAPDGEVRVASLAGTGVLEGRRVRIEGDASGPWIGAWTPDDKRLVVWVGRKDGTGVLGALPVGGGPVTPFAEFRPPFWIQGFALSPDGRFVAMEMMRQNSRGKDIAIATLEGAREVARVVQPGSAEVIGWSADGTRLIFTNSWSGSLDLYSQAFAAGRLVGAPEASHASLPLSATVLGMSASGAVYWSTSNQSVGVQVRTGTLDMTAGVWTTPPSDALTRLNLARDEMPISWPSAAWSPDGQHLAIKVGASDWRSQALSSGRILITTIGSNTPRVLRTTLTNITGPMLWAPDGKALVVPGGAAEGLPGLWRVDASSGETSRIELNPEKEWTPKVPLEFSRDGTSLRFTRGRPAIGVVVQKDLATGRERELTPRADYAGVSPDGSKLYYRRRGPDNGTRRFSTTTILERDLATGQEREIFTGDISGAWLSPDGRVIGTVSDSGTASSQAHAMTIVPVDGSPARELMKAAVTLAVSGEEQGDGPPLGLWQTQWAPDSRSLLVLNTRGASLQTELWWAPIDGAPRALDVGGPGDVMWVSRPPNGPQAALIVQQKLPPKPAEVWVLENALPPKK